MKEELNLGGNDLVQLQTMYTVGAVVGQIPFIFLFTKVPMFWLIPFMDVAWGIFTLLQYRAHSYAEMAAYRFLVGWFEVSNYANWTLGLWSKRTDRVDLTRMCRLHITQLCIISLVSPARKLEETTNIPLLELSSNVLQDHGIEAMRSLVEVDVSMSETHSAP